MKLKCDKHKRRVVSTDRGFFMHRTGDAGKCNSRTATIGTQTFDPSSKNISLANIVKNGR